MNSLSWLLYFAGIAGPLTSALALVAWILVVVLGLSAFAGGISYALFSETSTYDSADVKSSKLIKKAAVLKWLKGLPKLLAVPCVCFLLSGLIPPKETLYLIAASEVGEEVVTSPTMTKAIDALNRLLDGVAVKKVG